MCKRLGKGLCASSESQAWRWKPTQCAIADGKFRHCIVPVAVVWIARPHELWQRRARLGSNPSTCTNVLLGPNDPGKAIMPQEQVGISRAATIDKAVCVHRCGKAPVLSNVVS